MRACWISIWICQFRVENWIRCPAITTCKYVQTIAPQLFLVPTQYKFWDTPTYKGFTVSLSIVSFPFVHSSTCQSNFVNFDIFDWKPHMWSRDNYMRNYIQTIITVVPILHTMRKLVLKFTHTQTRFQLRMDKNSLDLMEWISAEIFMAYWWEGEHPFLCNWINVGSLACIR